MFPVIDVFDAENLFVIDWIGAISCQADIIVAGSGLGNLYTYHAGSRSLLQSFKADSSILSIEQVGFDIISAGHEPLITTWSSEGRAKVG